MDGAPIALIMSRKSVLIESRSAEPGAPVVEARPRRQRTGSGRRTRSALAARLHRLADAVEPASASCGAHPAH